MKTISIIIIGICVLAGCSTPKQAITSWAQPNTDNYFRNIVVIALVGEKNQQLEQQMEENIASEMKKRDYHAVSYIDAFGTKLPGRYDKQGAIDSLRNKGVDAVVTIALLDSTKSRHNAAGAAFYPAGDYQNFWRYYGPLYTSVYTPNYYTTDSRRARYYWETNLYDINSENLVYSSQTELFYPASTQSLATDYSREIVQDMVDKKILSTDNCHRVNTVVNQ